VRFSVGCIPATYEHYVEWVRAAEAAGFDSIGTGDSSTLWNDPFVTLAVAAQHSERVELSLQGTNPLTRHPVVAAAAMESLQLLSGGRFRYGLGSGDSAVANIGRPRASLAEVEEYGRAVQGLCAGRTVSWQGQDLALSWGGRPVPVLLCAEGPRTQRLAGRFADGAVLYNGISEEVVTASLAALAEGAAESGRRLEDLDLWWPVVFHLCPDVSEGVEAVKFSLAGTANRAFRHSLSAKLVPEELHAGFRGLQAEYRSSEHQQLGRHAGNAALVDRYGLTDYLVRRFAVIGPPEHCIEQLGRLAGYGVRNVSLSLLSRDLPGQIDSMGEIGRSVLPALAA
jgi:5,10-methylenetetrahydromethanopterin reductase